MEKFQIKPKRRRQRINSPIYVFQKIRVWCYGILILLSALQQTMTKISLVKNRVHGLRKDLFSHIAMLTIVWSFRLGLCPPHFFLPIYVIMMSFPQKLAKAFSFVDFYFIHSHFSFE